jgi:hypothetical protein
MYLLSVLSEWSEEREGCIKDRENKYMNIENVNQRDAEI